MRTEKVSLKPAEKRTWYWRGGRTNFEASTIVRTVAGLDGVEDGEDTMRICRRTLGRMFRVRRECMYPKPARGVRQVRLVRWDEKWKAIMSEFGGDSRLVEDVGSVGNLSKGREGTHADETG